MKSARNSVSEHAIPTFTIPLVSAQHRPSTSPGDRASADRTERQLDMPMKRLPSPTYYVVLTDQIDPETGEIIKRPGKNTFPFEIYEAAYTWANSQCIPWAIYGRLKDGSYGLVEAFGRLRWTNN